MFAKDPSCKPCHHKQHHYYTSLANQVTGETDKAVRGTLKISVEPPKELSKRPESLLFGFEQQRRKCGAERESVECGKHHGDRDRDGKLLIQPASDARYESCRHKH